ncbi:MAG: hypothetical protein LBB23_02740 [Rickettsiales bacterium]|nr:hypothetical protein [Rickettsiales bacterium]
MRPATIPPGSIRASYFAENDPVTCGSWANKKDIESQILKATASSRNWATFAGAAGGAVVGVTGMELVGSYTALGNSTGHLESQKTKGAFGFGGKTDTATICTNLDNQKNKEMIDKWTAAATAVATAAATNCPPNKNIDVCSDFAAFKEDGSALSDPNKCGCFAKTGYWDMVAQWSKYNKKCTLEEKEIAGMTQQDLQTFVKEVVSRRQA